MKRLRYIVLVVLAAACWRCGKEGTEIDIPAQRAVFETFLEGVARDTGLTVDAELARQYIYKLTLGTGDGSRQVTGGEQVTIEYYGFVFDQGQELGMGGLFTTNNRQAAVDAGITDYPNAALPPEELTIRQGAGEILRGIDQGLVGAGLQDTVLLYLTSDLTYGQQATGLIQAGTPTVFLVMVHQINE